YRLSVDDERVAKLIVPDGKPPFSDATPRVGPGGSDRELAPGGRVREMYLCFSGPRAVLDVGQVATIDNLTVEVGQAPGRRRAEVHFSVLADLDVDFLSPREVESPVAVLDLFVV